SAEVAREIEQTAWSVPGVTRVVTQFQVKPRPVETPAAEAPPPPWQVKPRPAETPAREVPPPPPPPAVKEPTPAEPPAGAPGPAPRARRPRRRPAGRHAGGDRRGCPGFPKPPAPGRGGHAAASGHRRSAHPGPLLRRCRHALRTRAHSL